MHLRDRDRDRNRAGTALRAEVGSGAWRGSLRGLVATLFVALLPSGAFAQHFDVLLYDNGVGDLRAGGVDVDTSTPEVDVLVIEGEMFGDTGAVTPTYTGEDPGFFSFSDGAAGLLAFPDDNLPGSAAVTLDFLTEPTLGRTLSYWDDGLGLWTAVPAAESITFEVGATNFGAVDGTSEVLGIALGSTSGTGFLDDHPDYVGGALTAGAYLLFGQASVAGLSGPSNPFWMVMGTLDECEETASCNATQEAFNEAVEEQIEAAILYTENNLAFFVPEPGTFALSAMGLVGLGFLRRPARRRS